MTTRRFRTWLLPAVLAAASATVILSMTFAGTAAGQSPTLQAFTVAGAAFTPDDSGCSYSRNGYSGEIQDGSECDYAASIQLPHGSTVVGVFVFYDSNESGGRSLHMEENFWTGGHNDIADVDLPECTPSDDQHPCIGAQLFGFDSPDINNAFFGYAGWLSSGGPGFILYRLLVVVSVPAGAGPASNPLGPVRLPQPDKNPR